MVLERMGNWLSQSPIFPTTGDERVVLPQQILSAYDGLRRAKQHEVHEPGGKDNSLRV